MCGHAPMGWPVLDALILSTQRSHLSAALAGGPACYPFLSGTASILSLLIGTPETPGIHPLAALRWLCASSQSYIVLFKSFQCQAE